MTAHLRPPVNRNDHIKGPHDAVVELVEYGDYQCPHCGAAHPVVKSVEDAFHGKLKFVYRHFPLMEIHPMAVPAAIAAEAADLQGKFWKMHDMIFENQAILSIPALVEFARVLDLNIPAFERDMQDRSLLEKVEADFESGMRSGVNGTPSFFINGEKYNGSYDFIALSGAIDAAIKEAEYH
jgi:protein-disulfide isomerase